MEELLKAIAVSTTEEKILLLPQALEQGESGIDYLLECLEDPCLEIRAKAYELLQSVKTDKAKNALANGLLLNPGDKLYHVLTRDIWFNDSFFSISSLENGNNVFRLATYEDYRHQGYKVIRFEEAAYITTNSKYYFKFQQAESKAKSIHLDNITKISISEFDLDEDREAIKQWCDLYQISAEICEFQIDRQMKQGWDKWQKLYEMPDPWNSIYWFTVEEYLKNIENLDLLGQLWEDCVGKLAYVHCIYFGKKTYLSIDFSNNQKNSMSEKVYMHFDGGDSKQLVAERWKYRSELVKIAREAWENDIPF